MSRNQCPNCKTAFTPGDDLLLRRLLDKIKFKCLYNSYGCSDSHNYSNYEYHLQTCNHRLVNCEYCQQNIMHTKLEDHYNNCTKFRTKCPNCTHSYSRDSSHDRIDCISNKVTLLFEMFNFLIRGYDFVFKSSKKIELNQLN